MFVVGTNRILSCSGAVGGDYQQLSTLKHSKYYFDKICPRAKNKNLHLIIAEMMSLFIKNKKDRHTPANLIFRH